MHYAVILADILIISSVGFIAIKLNKRKRRKESWLIKISPIWKYSEDLPID